MARGGWTNPNQLSTPEVLRRRNSERVFAFLSQQYGLAAFLRPVKTAPPNEQEDRVRIRVALEAAFGSDESSREYYTRTLASDAAHELRRLIDAKPVSSRQLSPVISYVHSLRNCLLQTGTEKGLFDEFIPVMHATYLASILGDFEKGPPRVVAFLRGAQRLPRGAVLPKICERLIAYGKSMEENSPELDTLLRDLDLLPQLFLPDSTMDALTTILDTLGLDHTWHDRMDQLEADVRAGKLVDYDTLRKKGQEMIEKGEWIQSSKKVNKKYIRDDKKNMKKGTRPSSRKEISDNEGAEGGRRRRKVKRKVKNREDPPDVANDEREDDEDERRLSNEKRRSREKAAASKPPQQPAVIELDDDEDDERRNSFSEPPPDIILDGDEDDTRERRRSSKSKTKTPERVPPLDIPTDIDEPPENRTPVPQAPRRRKKKGPLKRKYRPGQEGYVPGTRESEPARPRGLSTPSKRRRFSLDKGDKKNLSVTQQRFVERFAIEETAVDESIENLL